MSLSHKRRGCPALALAALLVSSLQEGALARQPQSGSAPSLLEQFRSSCANFAAEGLTCEKLGWQRARKKRRVIDGIAYNGEAVILEARLRELAPVVDHTAILTTEINFHGKAHSFTQPSGYKNARHMRLPRTAFNECWSSTGNFDKLCAMAVTKNSIATVIDSIGVDDDDWVLFSDPDEIPDREVVRLLRECEIPIHSGHQHPNHLRLWSRAHYMYNTRCEVEQSLWTGNLGGELTQGPVAMSVKTMRKVGFMGVRKSDAKWCRARGPYASCGQAPVGSQLDIPCSAWHLSSFGGLEMLQRKMNDNTDMWEHLSAEEVKDMVSQCKERDANRTILNSRLRQHPARRYPFVPHSVADDSKRFATFFMFDTTTELQQTDGQRRRRTGATANWRRRRRRTANVD